MGVADRSRSARAGKRAARRARPDRNLTFDEVYRRFHGDVYRLCLSLVREPARAEDLAQETFLRAFKHRRRFDNRRPYWPWLSTIARRMCIDEIRTRISHAQVDEALATHGDHARVGDTTFDEVANLDEQTRLRARLQTALRALPARDRRVVLMRSVEGLSYQEIALADGTSVDAVRNVSWRARTVLRALLQDLGEAKTSVRILVLVGSIKAIGGRTKARVERFMRHSRSASFEHVLVAQVAALAVVGVAAVAIGSHTGRPAFEAEPLQGLGRTPRSTSRTIAAPFAAGMFLATPPTSTDALRVSGASVNASARMGETKEKRVAPRSSHLTIQVVGPNGEVLAEYEMGMECGDQGATILPDDGPIIAVC